MLGEWFALSLTQNDIYLDQLKHRGSPLYNIGGYIDLRGVELDRLRAAHLRLAATEEIFGLRIITTENRVGQCLMVPCTLDLPLLDFSQEADPMQAAQAWLRTVFESPIGIDNAPLFRAWLVQLAEDRHWYVGLAHHIAMDGWGFSNWASTLSRLYNASPADDVAAPAWREVAEDDEQYAASDRFQADRNYWIHRVGEAQSLFPARYRTDASGDGNGLSRRRVVPIDRQTFVALGSLAKSMGAGVAHLFLGLLSVYFQRTHGEQSILFGVPFHNRRKPGHKRMLGVFMGMSVLRIDVSDQERTFGDHVRAICIQQLTDLRHQRYPLGGIVRDLGIPGKRRTPFDVAFNYLRLGGAMRFGDGVGELVYVSHHHDPLPLMVTLCEYGGEGGVELQVDYNLDYVSEEDADWLQRRLAFLVDALPGMADSRLSDIEVLPLAERERLLEGFGDPPLRQPSGGCLHHLFERQARETPEATAVDDGVRRLTYRELDGAANRIAGALVERGITCESLVGICMERNVGLVAAVLGVLKAGGAYVPLDSAYPPLRLTALVEDSKARLVITHDKFADLFAPLGVDLLRIDDDPSSRDGLESAPVRSVTGHHLAYVIYTSGSTGKPKGVQITHANAVALLDWARTVYAPEDLAMTLASTSLNFDLSVFELFAPLMTGGCCVLVRDILALIDHPRDVTLINTVPSAMRVMLDRSAIPSGVRVVNLAGEPLPMHLVNGLLATGDCPKVINLYGPSEDTTYSTYAVLQTALTQAPVIGRAIAGTRAYILDAKARMVPFGSVGELHLAGSGLARGYLHAPELTAEKFLSGGFLGKPGERIYRTGDFVRYNDRGDIEYIGRLDEQVKIRGFRIELGEIRQCIEQFKGVKSVAVLAHERQASDKMLVAYVERGESSADAADDDAWLDQLKSFVQTRLPVHMVPSEFVRMATMPLTTNGKIDKKKLQFHSIDFAQKAPAAPITETEIRLSHLWSSLLGVTPGAVGTNTSLYEFGGHSLLIVRLANAVQSEFGALLPVQAVFESVDLAQLARKIDVALLLQQSDQRLGVTEVVSEGIL